jgi:hypothetical protein
VRLAGDLRNVDVDDLTRVFIPGFPQIVTVSAVDANYYDWFRTHNDRLSGTGLISRIDGGIGVFGSLVRLHILDLSVVSPQPEPVAGTFRIAPEQQSTAPYLGFELYVESRASRSDQGDALSGRHEKRLGIGESDPIRGVLGTVRGTRIELALLRRFTARDTVEIFSGEVQGNTIIGEFSLSGGQFRFMKQGAANP